MEPAAMNTYRVDFAPEALKGREVRSRLMRDIRKVAKSTKAEVKPRYLWKRRTDGSLGYWFQLDADLQKDGKAMALLEPYGLRPSAPPSLPQSEWRRL
jgi:hypothetical protein